MSWLGIIVALATGYAIGRFRPLQLAFGKLQPSSPPPCPRHIRPVAGLDGRPVLIFTPEGC